MEDTILMLALAQLSIQIGSYLYYRFRSERMHKQWMIERDQNNIEGA